MVRTCAISLFLLFCGISHAQTILDWSATQTATSGGGGGSSNFPLTTNIIKGNGSGGGLPAYPGVDYQAVFSLSSFNYGNGSTNGIASATTTCGTTPCTVIVPSSYPLTEQVSGFSVSNFYTNNPPPAVTNLSNVSYLDFRLGGISQIDYNCPGMSSTYFCSYNVYNLINPTQISANPNTPQFIGNYLYQTNVIDGGINCNSDGCGNKSNWQPYIFEMSSWTPGQHIPFGLSAKTYSIGDTVTFDLTTYCYAGLSAATDEGCEPYDIETFGPSVNATMTVTSVSGSQVTGNFTAGAGTQGTGRFFIKTNGLTNSTGTISNISCPGNDVCTETGVGTNWSPTTGFGTIATAVTGKIIAPSTQTVTLSFTTGSISSITANSTAVCIGGIPGGSGGNFEIIKPTAVGTNTITATFYKSHGVGSYFATSSLGGCGYATSLTAENVVNSGGNVQNKSQTIVGTMVNAVPVLAVTSATSRKVHYVSNEIWDQWQSLLTSSNNTYNDYTFAETYSVQSQGAVGNTVTLGPNIMALSAGDTIQQPHYYAERIGPGQIIFENYWPTGAFTGSGFGINYRQPLTGNDSLISLHNDALTSLYENGGPLYPGPTAITITGETKYSFFNQYTPNYGFAVIGCPAIDPCSRYLTLFNVANGDSGSDIFEYVQASGAERWIMTTKNGSGATFNFNPTGLDIATGSITIDNSAIPITLTSPSSTLLIGLSINHIPQYEAIGVGCDAPCTSTFNFLGAANTSGFDYIQYNQALKNWVITTNVNSYQYTFGSSQFTTPFFGVTSGIFSGTSVTYSAADAFQFANVSTVQQTTSCTSQYLGLIFPVGYNTGSSGLEFCTLGQGGTYDQRYLGQGNNNVTYSASATFSNLATSNSIYLTGNLAFTIPSGFDGQEMDVRFCQDTAGSHTVTFPPNVKNAFSANSGLIGTTANACSYTRLKFYFLNGNKWYAEDAGYINAPI